MAIDRGYFTSSARVRAAIGRAQELSSKQFSDVLDSEGHQYVDVVLEGGGVLGIALVGYTYALEAAGIRFLGIGGTSAGAINALLLAAIGGKAESKSEHIIDAIANLDIAGFEDGGPHLLPLIEEVENHHWLSAVWHGRKPLQKIWTKYGVHPGKEFFNWIDAQMRAAGTPDVHSLLDRAATAPADLFHRERHELKDREKECSLAFITAEITTETKVDFPRMAPLFWQNWQSISPAHFVRASMSVPFFFEPYVVDNIPKNGDWAGIARFNGPPPARCVFVDGGIMSNFPIDMFHDPFHVPCAPTFGIKLDLDRDAGHKVGSVLEFTMAMFNSARHTLDVDFLMKNPDYRQLVGYIDTTPHHWLNFSMGAEEKLDLFERGVEAGTKFLANFDWNFYKQTRKSLIDANSRGSQRRPKATDS